MPAENPPSRPLVGRRAELAQLAGMLDGGGVAPRPAVVLLSGDAGVGKTRLLTELRDRLTVEGWQVVAGHCLDFGGSALPYLPFSEIFGRLAADSATPIEELVAAHPAVRHLQPGRVHARDVGPDDGNVDRAELFEAVHAVLEEIAQRSPLLVVVEDVHWADQSTRDMLSFLFARQFSRPVSIVATYRGDDLHRRHPLRATVAQWTRTPGVSRVQLSPLDDVDVRTLVRSIHPDPLRELEIHAIVQRAEGNAFFVEELVGATEAGGRALPDDLADLLLVRLDRLDEAAGQVVRTASVAGRRVSHDLLAIVAGLEPPALDKAVRSAVEANIMVATGSGGYSFRHALLGEAVYDDLLPGERVRIHAAYAAALRGGDVEGPAAELARHARAAHDVPTAVTASIQAGDDAMSLGGPDEAAAHYERALALASDPRFEAAEAIDLAGITIKASEATAAAGNPYRALSLVQDRLAQLPVDVADLDRARLLVALGTAALISDSNINALEATTEALTLLGPERSKLRAVALNVHAQVNADRQRDDEAGRFAADALELGAELGLARVVADATTTLARLDEKAGDPETSRRSLEKIVAQARANGHVDEEVRGLHALGAVHYEAGHLGEAATVYGEASERAAESGRPWAPYGFDARMLAGITAYVQGRWDDALSVADVTGQSPPAPAEAALAAVSLSVLAGRGDNAAFDVLPHVRVWWDRDGIVGILGAAAAIDLYGDLGDIGTAIELHDEAVRSTSVLWQAEFFLARVRLSALLTGQLATSVSRTGATDRTWLVARGTQLVAAADEAMRRAERRRKPMGPEGVAWARRARAEHVRLRWLAGIDSPSENELVSIWEATVGGFTAYGHRFETARSQARLAAVLRATGRAAVARELADQARSTARELGAEPLLTELRGLGGRAQTRTSESSRRGEALTAREQEILGLVAQGGTNGQIGRQLFISAKTVSVHVSNILAKLGASSRTEAVALARRAGLLSD